MPKLKAHNRKRVAETTIQFDCLQSYKAHHSSLLIDYLFSSFSWERVEIHNVEVLCIEEVQ